VFTKFPSCIAGPTSEIPVGSETVDWEVELVVALGRATRRVHVERAWDHVAGLMVGQDISDRAVQRRPPAQWSLAKSFTGFGPTGPFLVTVDDVPDRDDLELGCSVNGEEVQKARTSDLVFPVPELVSRLSHIVTLWPGDLIFTGTPSGVGYARTPPRFLPAGRRREGTMALVETVRGPVETDRLGATLMHEHVFILDSEINHNYPERSWEGPRPARIGEAAETLRGVADRGISTIVDLTVLGLGRSIPNLQAVNAEVDINIVVATGVYTFRLLPDFIHNRRPRRAPDADDIQDVMVDMFVDDITRGIADTGVRAGILKCCTDSPGVVEQMLVANPRRLFEQQGAY
jgi:hypothetical protein